MKVIEQPITDAFEVLVKELAFAGADRGRAAHTQLRICSRACAEIS